MSDNTKQLLQKALLYFSAAACLGVMIVAYSSRMQDQNLFTLIVGIFGAFSGYLFAKASSVDSDYRLERILGASLIKEKEQEVKTVEELKMLYQNELATLKEVIEREGNSLLLSRLKEKYVEDVREKLREIESIDAEISKNAESVATPEVEQLRKRIEGLLSGVRNPEEDDRLIRQLSYATPLLGNFLYLIYSIMKKFDPTLQDRMHTKMNSIAALVYDNRRRFIFMFVLLLTILIACFGVLYFKSQKGYE